MGRDFLRSLAELGTSHYGLHPHWPKHDTRRLLPGWSRTEASADEIARHLHDLYCGAIGVEFMHLESAAEREWFAREFEASAAEPLDAATRTRIATSMLVSQVRTSFGSKLGLLLVPKQLSSVSGQR